MANQIRVMVLDVNGGRNGLQDKVIECSLSSYYKELNCDLIDVTYRKIGGERFTIICDDEGLLKDGCKISLTMGNHPDLCGNLILCNEVETPEGTEFASLTDEQVERIKRHTTELMNLGTGEVREIIIAQGY